MSITTSSKRKHYMGLLFFLPLAIGVAIYILATHPSNPLRLDREDAKSSIIANTSTRPEVPNLPKPTEPASKHKLQVSGWIANWGYTDGLNTYKNSAVIDSVSPTWYYLAADGSLALKSGARSSALVSLVHTNGDTVIPSISNPNADQLSNILRDSSKRGNLVTTIVNEVTRHNYDGIDIDFENLNVDDRIYFSSFIEELATSLHFRQKTLTIAVLPKTDEFIYQLSESRLAQDWEEIGKHVDEFRIMGYDFEHNSTTTPGPVSSVLWLEGILDYAEAVVPTDKIVLGLPLYGYRWSTSNTTSFTWLTEQELERAWGVKGKLDPKSKEKTLKRETDELWYQDAESLKYRIDIAKKRQLKGVVFWRLGREDGRVWDHF